MESHEASENTDRAAWAVRAMTVPLFNGRKPENVEASLIGPLKPEDLIERSEADVRSGETLKRLRQSHHYAAQLLSQGMKHAEVSMRTGYSVATVGRLTTDPSFQELLSFYADQDSRIFADTRQKVANLAGDALDEIAERLTENPDAFTNTQLTELMKLTLDRSGHGPTATQLNLNAGLSAKDLEELKHAEAELVFERTPDNSEPVACVEAEYTTISETKAVEGEQGEGVDFREDVREVSEEAGTGGSDPRAVVRVRRS